MSPDLFGWIWVDLSSFHGIKIDFVDLGHQIWVHFYEIWLDLDGCNRFEWIWVDLGGLELI